MVGIWSPSGLHCIPVAAVPTLFSKGGHCELTFCGGPSQMCCGNEIITSKSLLCLSNCRVSSICGNCPIVGWYRHNLHESFRRTPHSREYRNSCDGSPMASGSYLKLFDSLEVVGGDPGRRAILALFNLPPFSSSIRSWTCLLYSNISTTTC